MALESVRTDVSLQQKGGDYELSRVHFDEITEVGGPGGVNRGATWFPLEG